MLKAAAVGSALAVGGVWSYLRHIQLPVGPNRLGWEHMVFGHRGCREIPGVPENTIAAFSYANSHHATGIELDVRLTADNVPIIFHDGYLSPLMQAKDPKQRITDTTFAELKEICYRDDPSGTVRMPTLEDAIIYCRDQNLRILIETKEQARPAILVEQLLALYDKYADFMYENTMVISFNPFILYKLRARNKKIAVCILHRGNLISTWKAYATEPIPALFALFPGVFDRVFEFVQTRLAPWVCGVSAIGPRYTLYNQEYQQRWVSRRIAVYLWGYEKVDECTEAMKNDPGVFVACDDRHEMFFK
jgi:glycerophosphoryl diester phosphodiesterase